MIPATCAFIFKTARAMNRNRIGMAATSAETVRLPNGSTLIDQATRVPLIEMKEVLHTSDASLFLEAGICQPDMV